MKYLLKKMYVILIAVLWMTGCSGLGRQNTEIHQTEKEESSAETGESIKVSTADDEETLNLAVNGMYNRSVISDGKDIFYTDFHGIYKESSDGTVTCLYDKNNREGIAVYGQWIYFLPDNMFEEKNYIYRVSKDGTALEKVIEGTLDIKICGDYLVTMALDSELIGMTHCLVYKLNSQTGLVEQLDETYTALMENKRVKYDMKTQFLEPKYVENFKLINQHIYAGIPMTEIVHSDGYLEYHMTEDGQVKLVFVSNNETNKETVIAEVNMADKIANDFDFEWPVMMCGDYAVYTDITPTTAESKIFIKNIRTLEEQMLVENLFNVYFVNFDGQRVYYLTSGEDTILHICAVDIITGTVYDLAVLENSWWDNKLETSFVDYVDGKIYYYDDGIQCVMVE